MSFVEKNKAWLLPLLGVGVAAVVWMNIRTFSGTPAPEPTPSTPSEPANPATPAPPGAIAGATPEPPPAANSPEPTPAVAGAGADLWEDLRGLAAPPPALADETSFLAAGRQSAMVALHPTALPKGLPIPGGVREPQPAPDPKGSVAAETPETPPPDLDFLIHGASGSRAWFEGRAYRTGDPVGPPQRSVGAIGTTTVELKGPKGKTILSTNPFHHSGPAPKPAVEAP